MGIIRESGLRSDGGFGLTILDDGRVAKIGACGHIEFCSSGGVGNAFKEGAEDTPELRRSGDGGIS